MPHRVLLEGCQLTLSQGTGIATYTRALAKTVRASGYATELLIDVDKPVGSGNPILDAITVFDATRPDPWSPLRRRMRRRFGSPFGIRAINVSFGAAVADFLAGPFCDFNAIFAATDVDRLARLHFGRHGTRARIKLSNIPTLFHATQAIPIAVRGCPNIYTIHDLVPLKLPFSTRDNKNYVFNMIRRLCRDADHVVTVSEFSRQEIIKLFGIDEMRITSTGQTTNLLPEALAWTDEQAAVLIENLFSLLREQYFLFVGAIEPKKNLSRLIDAYAASGSKHPLVIAGGLGWQYEDDLARIADERFLRYDISGNTVIPQRQVRRLPYLAPDILVALMRGARALLFPSLYEGFGLPVLEAMSLGIPVMTSNAASLPEVAGDAAVLVDPLDIADMARAIRTLDADADLRRELKARGPKRAELFSPVRYQERVGELYRRVIG